ncbi:hypothetical protein FACUT_9319 [Fusarium acutatum]|uniref:Uncharacterized protein n=1 Tax=Fusarium acutatum TaxID=78861 RepID=A0A8H4JKI4_9HYPO|nr:hypothetical protein FACUT_9319 [Fusarium acutatum]
MWIKNCDSPGGDSADEATVCSEDAGISRWSGLGPNAKPELSYSHGFTWNQDRPFDMHDQLGAVPYGPTVNTQWFPQPVPILYPPPAYEQIRPSQLDPESDESENEPDQSPNDDLQVKTEDKNYFDPTAVALKELRMADVQLQSEIRKGLKSQRAMLSQSSSVVQKQLRQAQKYCEAIEKELKIVKIRSRDRHINVQGEIKELRGLVMLYIKEQMMLRRYLKDKDLIQIT